MKMLSSTVKFLGSEAGYIWIFQMGLTFFVIWNRQWPKGFPDHTVDMGWGFLRDNVLQRKIIDECFWSWSSYGATPQNVIYSRTFIAFLIVKLYLLMLYIELSLGLHFIQKINMNHECECKEYSPTNAWVCPSQYIITVLV